MKTSFPRIFSLGTGAASIEFGAVIDERTNELAAALAADLLAAPFPGFREAVPAYVSVTVFYDVVEVDSETDGFESAFDAVSDEILRRVSRLRSTEPAIGREFVIPVTFGGDVGPDLDSLADRAELTADEVVEIFISGIYRVFMIGFMPGFPYLATVDERIAAPRKSTPRTFVPRGSVGIAGFQTGIYPVDSPGGWQIIGRTAFSVFDVAENPPSLFSPGDQVRFTRA